MSEPFRSRELGPDRPRPIHEAAKGTQVITAVGAIITALAAVGVLTLEQSDALQIVLTIVAPVAAAATGVLTAFGVVNKAEPKVTPLGDPRDAAGVSLVPPPGEMPL